MLYKLKNNELEAIKFDDFESRGLMEKDLEDLLAYNLMNIIFEDCQLMPVFQERKWQSEADLWALDQRGNLVIFELKRGTVSKNTTLQVLGYAQTHGMKTYCELEENYRKYANDNSLSLKEVHKETFQLDMALSEDQFNKHQKLIIVGASGDIGLMRAVDYWKEKGIDIDFIPYRMYDIEGETYFEFFAKPYDYHLNPKYRKGIIFDTCGSYNHGYKNEMYVDEEVRAWGEASRFIYSFNKNDYVFYYVQGKGIVAVGKIISDVPKSVVKDGVQVAYHKITLVVPTGDIDENKYITASKLSELLEGKRFYWARTAKTPYLTEAESQKVVETLKKLYNE